GVANAPGLERIFDRVHDASGQSGIEHGHAIPRGYLFGESRASRCQGKRATYQPGANDCDSFESHNCQRPRENHYCVAHATRHYDITSYHEAATGTCEFMCRSTASAIRRRRCINRSNCSGSSDCAPSQSAFSGSWWTSISNPSAPAATAAWAIGGTLSL